MLVPIVLFLIALVTVVCAGLLGVSILKGNLVSIHNSQERMTATIGVLTTFVQANNTSLAVNFEQHADLTRRMADHSARLSGHDEEIRKLRTIGHLHANKLMEIDPKWQSYRPTVKEGKNEP